MDIVSTLPSGQLLYLLLGFHFVIGGAGTIIAWRKGRDFKLWLFLGLTCGTAAFLTSLFLKPIPDAS